MITVMKYPFHIFHIESHIATIDPKRGGGGCMYHFNKIKKKHSLTRPAQEKS